MSFRGSFRRLLLCGVMLSSMMGMQAAYAQQPSAMPNALFNPNAPEPDIKSIPVLTNLVGAGAQLYYMGERSGLHGWFIVKDGQIQMIYVTSDKQTTVIGGMFTATGDNVTSPQIAALMERNRDVKALLEGSAKQQNEINNAGKPDGAGSVAGAPQGGDSSIGKLPSTSLSPGERLVADLKAAAGVVLGKNDKAELLYMIVAPGCPNCKKAWVEMREAVKGGKLQVRLVPVYNSTGDTEKNASAQLLRVSDPLTAWDKYVDGDVAALGGVPDPTALRAVADNLLIISKWNIQGYPYLVYRGSDGRIKIVQGKPERMGAVLADLIR